MAKSVSLVLFEALVVGVGLAILVALVQPMSGYIPNLSGRKEQIEMLIVVGFLFHVICEYTGVNWWYSKKYCQLMSQ